MKTVQPDSAGDQGHSNICLKSPGQDAVMLTAKWQMLKDFFTHG
jgi:hypothetical protein